MKKLKKDQKGFTMIELLIAIALTSLITAGLAAIIDQIFTGSARNSNHMVAVRQVQEAGYWVSLYAYSSQNTTITGGSGFPLILCWVDFDTDKWQKIEFSLNKSGLSGLRGSYYVNDVLDSTKTGKIPVFEFIDPDKTKTNCQVSGGSAFSLPDNGDKFVITGGATSDTGRITTVPKDDITKISVIPTGSGATATYDSVNKVWTWTTTTAGGTITVTGSGGVKGSWTSDTRAATAAITVDSDGDATLSSARGLVFTVTATVGAGRHTASETRIYKVAPKPVS